MSEDVLAPGHRVVLVRHAMPVIDPARSPGEWALADDTLRPVSRISAAIGALDVDGIVTSPEPKALGTARLVAGLLDLTVEEDEALREQGLDTIPWIADPDCFRAAVREHFERAGEAVFGDESSSDAALRFAGAVNRARSRYRCPVMVTHGRVMCGYLRSTLGIDPMGIWETLRLPDAFVVDLEIGSVSRVDGKDQ